MAIFSMKLPNWRYKRFHVSYILTWLAVGLLVGIFVGRFMEISAQWVVYSCLFFVIGVSVKSRRWYACVIVMLVGFSFGVFRGGAFMQSLSELSGFTGKQTELTGMISQDPVVKNGSNMWQAQLTNVRVGHKTYTGEVYATIVSDETLKRGDDVTIYGKAQEGFGSFRLSFFRSELKHVSRPNDVFLAARDGFAEATRKVVPEPEASLDLGFLVGEKSTLSNDLTEQLKTVGLTHIIVASGYNLTIFVRFARKLFARRSRYLAFVGSMTLVAGYVLVSGFSPSMNRAAVVTFLSLLAWYYGRKFHPVQLILYVACVSAFLYPSYLWTDLGWLLSFAAFTGVLVLAPILTRVMYTKDREPSALVRLIIETLSAEIMTLPIIVAAFGYIPVLALLANILVAPVIPFAMFFTFVAGFVGWLVPALSVLALPAGILAAYVIAIVEVLSSPGWARLSVDLPIWVFMLWYFLLLGVGIFIWKRRRVDLTGTNVVE